MKKQKSLLLQFQSHVPNQGELKTRTLRVKKDTQTVLRMVFSEQPAYNRKTGVETASLSLPVTLFQHSGDSKIQLVEVSGVEPESESVRERESTTRSRR
jgi:hypothetical protein